MAFRYLYWIPYLIIAIFSMFLYIRVLYIINRNKMLKSYSSFFFRLCFSQGIFDISNLFLFFIINSIEGIFDISNLFLFFIINSIEGIFDISNLFLFFIINSITVDVIFGIEFILSLNGIPSALAYYYNYYFTYAQVFGIVMLSLNRFAVVCFPHSRITKEMDDLPRWIISSLHVFVPLLPIIHMFFQPRMKYYEFPAGEISKWRDNGAVTTNALVITLLISISSLISALCYVFVLIKITKNMVTGHSIRSRREIPLIIVGFSLFLTLLFAAFFYVFCFIFSRLGDLKTVDSVGFLFTYVVLSLSVVNPWVLLITNRSTRKRILSRKDFDSSSVNIVSTNVKPSTNFSDRSISSKN